MNIRVENLTIENMDEKLRRPGAKYDLKIVEAVRVIIDDVAERGDAALIELTERFDGAKLAPGGLRVDAAERDAALERVPDEFVAALKTAADRIREFHLNQQPRSWTFERDGATLGQKASPIGRAGLYVPGGLANYPSSVLMNAIPAMIAGVPEIVLCVPPDKNGRISDFTLAAAAVVGIDEIYRVGGAQAIAAMAYGTETIRPVDKITGPGNIYVATAKKLVVGQVDIDMIAGPTEVVIIADGGARAGFIAADMIAQAEHDPLATAILLTDSAALAEAVGIAIQAQLVDAGRREIAERSLGERGRVYIVDDLDVAVEFANRFAPEHLEIMTADADAYLPRIKNAGAIFLGDFTPEALGDYTAGTNHVLPTGSTARFYSPLGVYDFIKWTSILSFSKEALMKIGGEAVCLAETEGLAGHGRSIRLRLDAPE